MSNLLPNNNFFDLSPSRFFENFTRPIFPNFPNTDIKETSSEYILDIDLPGIEKENISLDYQGETLYIEAKQSDENNETDQEGNIIRQERNTAYINRTYTLPNVDENNINAKYTNGVLHLNLKKNKQDVTSTKHIEIE
ncbi:Hsp20/alpha crystallin family protein [Staphylococcus gallinarum]|uniref:Hsp20/alpha crystallin family protein n=1 Tax=Staphylococcus xylosus TaxID=1288 RepID=A0A418IN87_STAXY|nr:MULTISPECIES: Hsp20/alpha crystallin family protein [Staphylococcus]PTG37700.1 heat-shock protein [Staphylococcus cohnii]MBU7218794.1 Hsp20/alpha crystallin family protein [Staphylococcus gallinarum]MCD8787467.1 Hsp20/alpha crystallin family protein [Staphylococcus gallinarum]MCD8794829.1 Hsp20/alpha crystallin family protein [Staphylococcus gallinarum]MCD8845275.1 Hsp20/alpha crystallin family protein [Staphylococcus gallinarum]